MPHPPDRDPNRPPLIPRYAGREGSAEALAERRAWISARTGVSLEHLAGGTLDAASLVGNIENPIGVAQVPIGLAGPLLVLGEHLREVVYVPLATTEGALVRSYERGMMAVTRAGGVVARVTRDENEITPSFACADLPAAVELAAWLGGIPAELQAAAQATTNHGRLVAIEPRVVGRQVLATLRYSTGDASGMNMVARASDALCHEVVAAGRALSYHIFSAASAEKRAAGSLLAGGKGKTAHAAARFTGAQVKAMFGVSSDQMLEVARRTSVGHFVAGALGFNAHLANGLAALFIACGQDVANVANAAVGVSGMEPDGEDGLYASVYLPSLTVGTVGGGTGLGTARECLQLLGCAGEGKALRFAEIIAATLLAGELSFTAAIANGEMASAHERYGRNRPSGEPARS